MKTKIKRTPNMNDVLKTLSKIHLSILYLKITSFIEFRSLEILKKSVLIHKFIYVIFQFKVREKREISVARF
jgi:hypothetical protein